MGAQLVKEVATKTNDVAGDGTTTATVLAQAMVQGGPAQRRRRREPDGAQARHREGRRGRRRGDQEAVQGGRGARTRSPRWPPSPPPTRRSARPIAEAIDKVGKDGVITVEESNTFGMELEFVEGMQFDKGYISPYFVTDPERMEAVLEDPYILIVEQEDLQRSRTCCRCWRRSCRPASRCVIIAEDVEGEALATLVVNKIRGTFNAVAVKAPGFGDRRKAMLQDIAILTGGQVISEEVGLKLENVTLDLLGRARKVVVTKDDTTIVEGGGDEDEIKGRITQIKAEIEKTDSDYDREKLQERLAKLSGGVAVIKVGAATEVELKEKKHRIEDAVVRDPRGGRRGHRPRRRRGAADPRRGGARQARPRRRRGDRREDRARRARGAAQQIAANAGYEGARRSSSRSAREAAARASTRPPASTAT